MISEPPCQAQGPFCASKRLTSPILKPLIMRESARAPAFPSPCGRGFGFRRPCRLPRRVRPVGEGGRGWRAGEGQVAMWLQSRGSRLSCLRAACERELGLLLEGQFHLPGKPYAKEPERLLLPQSQDGTRGWIAQHRECS